MGTVDKIKEAFKVLITPVAQAVNLNPQAWFGSGSGTYRTLFTTTYNGEKNTGEIGPIKNYMPDYYLLSLRSWQAYDESEMAKTIIDKYVKWVVSKGLKLQASPVKKVLESEGIKINAEEFNSITEARFSVWAKSKKASFNGMDNLNSLARDAFKNSKIGGDVLVILRYVNGCVKIQLIDGSHLQSPGFGTDFFGQKLSNGNTIRNGVEMSPSGEHVAYCVRQDDMSFATIPAKTQGMVTAFLVYGEKRRLDNYRGMPAIAVCLETLKKLERYKEATVASAEERAKIVYFIKHGVNSTGENPLSKGMAKMFTAGGANVDLPIDINGKELADLVSATTNKTTINMPNDSELKSLESKNELFFKEFYGTNADIICGSVDIPPDVAFSMYNGSFSASRAATKDWEHTITVNREDFTFQFYQPIYNFWLYTEILKFKIDAEGYLKAVLENNDTAIEAYQNARFTGPMFPHIDPLKEVKAEREKLGTLAAHIPLTTVEAATEVLNGSESDSNMEQFAEELNKAEELGLEAPEVNSGMAAKPNEKASVEEEVD